MLMIYLSISFCLGMLTMAFLQFGTQAAIDIEQPESGDELPEESED